MTAQELSETADTAAFKEARRGEWDALAAGWRKWSHLIEADQAVRLERTDPFVGGLHAALGGKSKARSPDSSPERIGSASQRPADGFSVPEPDEGGDGWTAHAAQSTSRP
jgi:hypothetical protein